MELAFPLLALAGAFVISNQSTSSNSQKKKKIENWELIKFVIFYLV